MEGVGMRKLIGLSAALVLAVGCSSTSAPGGQLPTRAAKSPITLRSVARELATTDHARHDAAYLKALGRLHHRCRDNPPAALHKLASEGYLALTRHQVKGASYLSVLRSLVAGAAPKGPPARCQRVVSALIQEVTGGPGSSTFSGYAATALAWAAAHRADAGHPGGYRPRLADGDASFVIAGGPRVTTLTRNFDPPVSQPLALSSIRDQLLPGGLHSVYMLRAANCDEQIYLSPALGKLLSSSSLGVMIELTSGRGISSHYDGALVNRARLTVGGRIGGQPCV
jgi:hypothetical protein